MKRIFSITRIRTFLLFALLLFAVLGGNFLYTGKENAGPLEDNPSSAPLTEGSVLTQSFVPEYPFLTSLALAVDLPEIASTDAASQGSTSADTTATGTLSLQILESSSAKLIYESNVSLSGVTDKWYLEFPVNKHLRSGQSYVIVLSARDFPETESPAFYLNAVSDAVSENGVCSFDNTVLENASLAVRYTYNVPVMKRIAAFAVVLIVFTGFVLWSLLRSKKSKAELVFRDLLAKTFPGTTIPLIHIAMFAAITLGAILLRMVFIPFKSNDYFLCYESWINDIRTHGGIASLANNIGDYPPLYMTLVTLVSYLPFEPVVIIKLLPCLFDFLLAIVCVLLLSLFNSDDASGNTNTLKKLTLYGVILCNPITLFNSSAWGQCDSIYTAFSLLALYCLFTPKTDKWYAKGDMVCLLYAIAFSFKLQAVFLLPFFGLVWILQKQNRLKPVHFLWLPIVYTLSCIPMFLAGRDLKVMFKIYLGQANRSYGSLTMNYPNLYSLIGTPGSELYQGFFALGLLFALLILLWFFYRLYCKDMEWNALNLSKAAAATVLIVCFFMPSIHERYAYLAEVLLLVIMIADAKYRKIALFSLLCTLFTYCTYLYQLESAFSVIPDWSIALVRLGCLLYLIKDCT